MNPLSYLIQNCNEILIDSAAAAYYENQNAKNIQKQLINDQKIVKHDDGISKKFIKRKISPNRHSRGNLLLKNDNKELLQKVQKECNQNSLPKKQIQKKKVIDIDGLKTQIKNLERDQEKMNRACCEKFNQLNEQFTRKNLEYQIKQQEINLIKSELTSTKKDIASLIKMFSSRKNRMISPERQQRNLRQTNYEKVNPYKFIDDGQIVRLPK